MSEDTGTSRNDRVCILSDFASKVSKAFPVQKGDVENVRIVTDFKKLNQGTDTSH